MNDKDLAIIFDCGATSVRVIAMDVKGKILAQKALPNETDEDPNLKDGRIWDIDKIWEKFKTAANSVTSEIDTTRIAGVTVTSFGVDGGVVDEKCELISPVISWQCERLHPIMNAIDKYIPMENLYNISGVYPFAFNTINKIIWLKENSPDVLVKGHRFLFVSSLFIQKLTGTMQNDTTMLGTSMMADLKSRNLSTEILDKLNISAELFGVFAEPGDLAGKVNNQAANTTGIPQGTPVFFTGHDTQFAIIGSGAGVNQQVLSSGTWEILMARTNSFSTSATELNANLTTELDAEPGVFNVGQNWPGSGIIEWFSRNFYPDIKGNELYENMIEDAEKVLPGANGVKVDPSFYEDVKTNASGSISGLTLNTSRAEIFRAVLEGLSFRLREGLEALQSAGKFKADRIICVGGGSKNLLWCQIRADVCNIPIQIIDQKETTALGGALFVFKGAGIYNSLDEAIKQVDYNPVIINPTSNNKAYDLLFRNYLESKTI